MIIIFNICFSCPISSLHQFRSLPFVRPLQLRLPRWRWFRHWLRGSLQRRRRLLRVLWRLLWRGGLWIWRLRWLLLQLRERLPRGQGQQWLRGRRGDDGELASVGHTQAGPRGRHQDCGRVRGSRLGTEAELDVGQQHHEYKDLIGRCFLPLFQCFERRPLLPGAANDLLARQRPLVIKRKSSAFVINVASAPWISLGKVIEALIHSWRLVFPNLVVKRIESASIGMDTAQRID